MRAGDCKHWNGAQNDCCAAGVNYREAFDGDRPGIALRMPCYRVDIDGKPRDRRGEQMIECTKYEAVTAEEEAADRAETREHLALIGQGLSPCCKAPLDRSRLIKSGRNKGSGWVFCSSCKRGVARFNCRA